MAKKIDNSTYQDQALWNVGVMILRNAALPIDKYSYWFSYEDALEYAHNGANAYVGQLLTVAETTNEGDVTDVKLYYINKDSELTEVGSDALIIELTYDDLVFLKNSNNLIPGSLYRIIDYEFLPEGYSFNVSEYVVSGNGKRFDLVLLALSSDKLSEEVHAVKHIYDGGSIDDFPGQNLNQWKIRYCLENDEERFQFIEKSMDNEEYKTKGFIYYMEDEFGNSAPIDFKNFRFKKNDTYNTYTFSCFSFHDNDETPITKETGGNYSFDDFTSIQEYFGLCTNNKIAKNVINGKQLIPFSYIAGFKKNDFVASIGNHIDLDSNNCGMINCNYSKICSCCDNVYIGYYLYDSKYDLKSAYNNVCINAGNNGIIINGVLNDIDEYCNITVRQLATNTIHTLEVQSSGTDHDITYESNDSRLILI